MTVLRSNSTAPTLVTRALGRGDGKKGLYRADVDAHASWGGAVEKTLSQCFTRGGRERSQGAGKQSRAVAKKFLFVDCFVLVGSAGENDGARRRDFLWRSMHSARETGRSTKKAQFASRTAVMVDGAAAPRIGGEATLQRNCGGALECDVIEYLGY